jgi:uncharacterized protein (TIGR02118 family)
MIKMIYCLRRQPHLSRAQFQDYWLNQHGPLVAGHAEVLRIRRYVQVHTSGDAINDALAQRRGSPEPYDGVAEIWFDSVADIGAPAGTPEGKAAMRAVREDEAKFIDAARSPVWVSTEHTLVE